MPCASHFPFDSNAEFLVETYEFRKEGDIHMIRKSGLYALSYFENQVTQRNVLHENEENFKNVIPGEADKNEKHQERLYDAKEAAA